jgi:hypothetical protein
MSRKEEIIAALIGVFIGSILGFFMSLEMIEKSKEHKLLIEENRLLHNELLNCEEGR